MKNPVFLLMLCGWVASSAFGRDSAERLRERLIFCSQFVIEDPGPVALEDTTHDCCRLAKPIHDCLIDREERTAEWAKSIFGENITARAASPNRLEPWLRSSRERLGSLAEVDFLGIVQVDPAEETHFYFALRRWLR